MQSNQYASHADIKEEIERRFAALQKRIIEGRKMNDCFAETVEEEAEHSSQSKTASQAAIGRGYY